MHWGFWALGFWASGFGLWASGFGLWALGFGCDKMFMSNFTFVVNVHVEFHFCDKMFMSNFTL
jgi:hypothetical protein